MRHGLVHLDANWRFRSRRPDTATLAWIRDPGSLTARLRARSAGALRVRVMRQVWTRPTRAEAAALQLSPGAWVLVREVVLEGGGVPWVIARSVIPRRTLTGRNRQLQHLGSRPLGAFLFRDPTLRRTGVKIVELDAARAPKSACTYTAGQAIWGRRSTFLLRGQPLLVAEYFLPALLLPS